MRSDYRSRKSLVGVKLIEKILHLGNRIFNINKAKELGQELGINPNYMAECLFYLRQMKYIIPIKKGLYGLSNNFLLERPLHEYEIAMAVTSPAVISHSSAMHFHGLIQERPNKVFVSVPTTSSLPRIGNKGNSISIINDVTYQFIQLHPNQYFGIQQAWLDGTCVYVTNIERTLIDGLIRAKYCQGVAEVIRAFRIISEKINLDKIIQYANKCDVAIAKRLGWVLEKEGISDDKLQPLLERPITGFVKFDPTRTSNSIYNKKWMIIENI
jgi:predicted transcriptional regulator of viral defense system